MYIYNLVHECNDDMNGNFDVIYCYIQITTRGTQHHEVLDLRNGFPTNKCIVVDGTSLMIQYFHYETDPSFVANEETCLLHQETRLISNVMVILFPISEC